MSKRPKLEASSHYNPPEKRDEESGAEWKKNRLKINHRRVRWELSDEPIGEVIQLAILAIHEHRLLWADKYNPQSKAPNAICCRSADSIHGYGLGRRPVLGEEWQKKVSHQSCETCPTGHPPMGELWLCKPDYECLVMLRTSRDAPFQFALLDAKGASAPRFLDLHRKVLVPHHQKTGKELYEFGVTAQLVDNAKKNAAVPKFDKSVVEFAEADVDAIAAMIPEANDFWAKTEERRWDNMRFIGWEEEDGDPPMMVDVAPEAPEWVIKSIDSRRPADDDERDSDEDDRDVEAQAAPADDDPIPF